MQGFLKRSDILRFFARTNLSMPVTTTMVVLAMASIAWAIAVPTAGDFGYDAYDITVNKILKGPIGFAIGIFAVGFGCKWAIQSEILPAIAAFVSAAILLQADAVVASFGMII